MNYGKWYYQDYFNDLLLDADGRLKKSNFSKGNTDKLIDKNAINQENIPCLRNEWKDEQGALTSFSLMTTYPGLLCGIGYNHEINKSDNGGSDSENDAGGFYQLGMYFDYSSGLPVIPGSSIKGALRSAVEEWKFLHDSTWATRLKENNNMSPEESTEYFIKEVFEGKGKSIYNRDIFFDAVPTKCGDASLFGEDYITHHPHPLKNPNPVRFLRVNPGITYEFRFILRDSDAFPSKDKADIFKDIIKTFGLGAKTNVGYGQFIDPK